MQRLAVYFSLLLLLTPVLRADDGEADDREAVEFFENRIRPVLVERCYECHNSAESQNGGLALDHRGALRRGGDSGAVIRPGSGADSLLVQAIRQDDDKLRMPQDGPKLAPAVIADFIRWIDMGAPDPRDQPPSAEQLASATSWEAIREHRKRWWSFQPIGSPTPPDVRRTDWSDHPVDRFILAKLDEAGLEPAEEADPRTLIRRVSFALTGLPPTWEEVAAFEEGFRRASRTSFGNLIDRLLESQHFGERWARHWMDWIRYADSHGSEGDPAIPHAWRYRDYLIRAINADVPYNQLVREHLAGDLLTNPRINEKTGINESAVGIGHYRLVQLGYQPTDALEEQVRFTENQIDVISKTFLGLTVSCARCHAHKFDAISQEDFYALYGIMTSCRPGLVTVDLPERQNKNKGALRRLKEQIRGELSKAWLIALEDLPKRLMADKTPAEHWSQVVDEATKEERSPLHAWTKLIEAGDDASLAERWQRLSDRWQRSRQALLKRRDGPYTLRWDLRGDDYVDWYRHGSGLSDRSTPAGGFHILPEGGQIVSNIYPAGIYTHLLSDKHNGVLTSPSFDIDMDELWVLVAGSNDARLRFSVYHYPRVGGVHQSNQLKGIDTFRWIRWEMGYWHGDRAYLELATAADIPVEARVDAARSWFGVAEVIGVTAGQVPPRDEPAAYTSPLFEVARSEVPQTLAECANWYRDALRKCIVAWLGDSMSNEQANFLGYFVRHRLLPNDRESLPQLAPLVDQYRQLEGEVPVPIRVPGVMEADPVDQPLMVRGNHLQLADSVPRRFLEAIDSDPYRTGSSGRLELAESILHSDNPLAARVVVNRVWHYIFGRGIVSTPDNFGRLGDKPTHPELLDYLASRFVTPLDEPGGLGYSIKKLIRLLVTSKTYQMSSTASPTSRDVDPSNRWISHMSVRRLEAEAIRDSLLVISGRLDPSQFGPPVGDDTTRRSVYVAVIRNSLSPLLSVFDAPIPYSTKGRRDVTNVPAQSLTLMNDPFVIDLANAWASRVVDDSALTTAEQRIERMFCDALARMPSDHEEQSALSFLQRQIEKLESGEGQSPSPDQTSPGQPSPDQHWRDLALAVLNFKEFIYIK